MRIFNKEKPWTYLLLIPLQLLLDVIITIGVMVMEVSAYTPKPDQMGHPFPAISFMVVMVLGIITTIVALISVVLTVRYSLRKKKQRQQT